MLYKKNSAQVYERLTELYSRRGLDRIYAVINVANPVMGELLQSCSDGVCSYPDLADRIAFWDGALRQRADVQDDSIPMCYCSELDQGLVSGLFNAPNIQFVMDKHRMGFVHVRPVYGQPRYALDP